MDPKEFAVILQRAAAIVGGRERLRSQLGASDELFERWLRGTAKVPVKIFLYVADMVAASAERQRMQALQAAQMAAVQSSSTGRGHFASRRNRVSGLRFWISLQWSTMRNPPAVWR